MDESIARGFFSTHETYAYKSISSYSSYKPWMTMPQLWTALINSQIFLSSLIGLSDATKLFFSSSLTMESMIEMHLNDIKFCEIISIDKAFVTMKSMILLPRIYLTQLWLVTFTTYKYKFITIRWNSLIFYHQIPACKLSVHP